jgi:hypothetical protein
LPKRPEPQKVSIPDHLRDIIRPTVLFKVSLGEVIEKERFHHAYHDRDMCVPHVLVKMCEAMVALGAVTSVGVFRVPGSQAQVDSLTADINNNSYDFGKVDLNTLASLMKSFLRELPDPLVPDSFLKYIRPDSEPDECISYLYSFPNQARDTLMYVVGFCQALVRNAEVTKMTHYNMLVCVGTLFHPLRLHDLAIAARIDRFITCLIDYLDVSPVCDFGAD